MNPFTARLITPARCACGETRKLLEVNELIRLGWPSTGDLVVYRYHVCPDCRPGSPYLLAMCPVPVVAQWSHYQ